MQQNLEQIKLINQKNQNIKNKFIIFLIILILSIFSIVILSKSKTGNNNELLLSTFIFNGIIWLILFIREIKQRAYSLIMMQWLFCIFFFFLAPLIQYIVGYFPWIYKRDDNLLLRANILLCYLDNCYSKWNFSWKI